MHVDIGAPFDTAGNRIAVVRRTAITQRDEECSVHQHDWHRPFLHHGAVADGAPGSREALMKGFPFLFSDNEMGISMLQSDEQMFYGSQAPERELSQYVSESGERRRSRTNIATTKF